MDATERVHGCLFDLVRFAVLRSAKRVLAG